MARQESDREDILREATALVERVELSVPGFAEPVVAGFRRDAAASFFFGADPVFQFNTAGELRRAYADGLLLKAEQGKLVSLTRQRSEHETALVRHELSDKEAAALLDRLRLLLEQLHAAVAAGTAEVIRQVPETGNVAPRVLQWLAARPNPTSIAARPHAGGQV